MKDATKAPGALEMLRAYRLGYTPDMPGLADIIAAFEREAAERIQVPCEEFGQCSCDPWPHPACAKLAEMTERYAIVCGQRDALRKALDEEVAEHAETLRGEVLIAEQRAYAEGFNAANAERAKQDAKVRAAAQGALNGGDLIGLVQGHFDVLAILDGTEGA